MIKKKLRSKYRGVVKRGLQTLTPVVNLVQKKIFQYFYHILRDAQSPIEVEIRNKANY